MLKYIGDFDLLVSEYGFEDATTFPIESYCYQKELHHSYIAIGLNRNVCIVADEDVWDLDKLYDLIKDGLVIKEEE